MSPAHIAMLERLAHGPARDYELPGGGRGTRKRVLNDLRVAGLIETCEQTYTPGPVTYLSGYKYRLTAKGAAVFYPALRIVPTDTGKGARR